MECLEDPRPTNPLLGTTSIDPTSRLLALPAELRSSIWQLAFLTNDEVDISTVGGPSSALLLTCHQIRPEVTKYYEEVYERYWRTSTFVLKIRPQDKKLVSSCRNIANLREEDLGHVTNLRIEGLCGNFFFDDGTWYCSGPCEAYGVGGGRVLIVHSLSHMGTSWRVSSLRGRVPQVTEMLDL